jgi:hypothetical protein
MNPKASLDLPTILPKASAAVAESRADREPAQSEHLWPCPENEAFQGAARKPNIHAGFQGGAQQLLRKAIESLAPKGARSAGKPQSRAAVSALFHRRALRWIKPGPCFLASAVISGSNRRQERRPLLAQAAWANRSVNRTGSQLRWPPAGYLSRYAREEC